MTSKAKRKATAIKTLKTSRGTQARRRSQKHGSSRGHLVLPTLLSVSILICLGALGLLGYRTVTASEFFEVAMVEVRGVSRASENDIKNIVSANTQKSGVWNSDLPEIRARIEKMPFVKFAAVSRILPNGIR
ncbi:MAG: FtsQ-type POTRA domain-containing protein, partial [Acidobacteria bacterium]|nr:FtsQ-type POTRA domain-containing protein [Acidobacteriota bacterium]